MFVLASGSSTRRALLENAGLTPEVRLPRVDESMVKDSLVAEGASARDIADTLAEMKALSIRNVPGAMVMGCDQVLSFGGQLLSKPTSPEDAIAQLTMLRGHQHRLLSAAVIVEDGRPTWRHISEARLVMRAVGHAYLESYVHRNWDSIRQSVGSYKLEEEGVRLFERVEGDYFTILGLPLLPLLQHLIVRGVIDG